MNSDRVRWSVCIPNYNYERYLARTLDSAAAAARGVDGLDLEIVIADNASTDRSVALVEERGDERIRIRVNACNVGFAGNLDRAATLASGHRMIMLSSDDLIRARALSVYRRVADAIGDMPVVMTSTMDQIDSDDIVTGRLGPDREIWNASDLDDSLSRTAECAVYRVDAPALLRRSLLAMKNPFNFAATCYRRADYDRVEGYGGGRLINPDKWFHWRLLGAVESAVWIDAPLFAYRWHAQNQTAQQTAQGALKYLIDEYASVLELPADLLSRAGLARGDIERAFVERDIGRHGLATLASGNRERAQRILAFGRATFPRLASRVRKVQLLEALLLSGGGGQLAARIGYRWYKRRQTE